MKINLWASCDKNGSCHISNVKPYVPLGNDEIFTIDPGYMGNGIPKFFLKHEAIPGLNFENSPKQLDIILNW